ncbi:glucose dehydrogenase [FAD, quinone]-like [Maniola jurtina]|uniref:glucose dehydrogenase [FAD, quinone]-like n=1 Tax=Maniola jurtina TaxID=191418 RepID=UPI001E689535|nr:glucose dehydrogenase [FAD, quinone]-like [Maniola jurtina]
MIWQPLNLTEVCPPCTPVSACSNFGFVYLSLLVQLFGGSAEQKKQEKCARDPVDGAEYDFIVVGAGAAGSVITNRLTENPHWKVLLLEAGGEEPDVTRVPSFFTVLTSSSLDWKYSSEPNGKSCLAFPEGRCGWPRGKGMGGSTAINAMAYVRGNKVDYDEWERMGNKGWSYDDCLPYFMKSERNLNKYSVDSAFHGVRGEQAVSWLLSEDDPSTMMIDAFNTVGIPFRDFNGAEQVGAMQAQTFSVDSERVSAYSAFIHHIRHTRPNCDVKPHCEVTKILIDDTKTARGVEYIKDGKKYTAYAKKEVITCAGVVNTAKLLMLSGIGPKEHLESLNIPVVQDLAVGENLQDHVSFNGMIVALSNETAPTVSEDQMLSDIKEYAEMKIKKGPLAGLGPIMSCSFIKSEPHLVAPDLQCQAVPVLRWEEFIQDPITHEKAAIMPTAYYNALVPRIMNVVPKSRGKMFLNKNDPNGPPEIHANYLGDERDIEPLMRGVRFLLSLEDTEAFKSRGAYFVREKMPHCKEHEWGTDEYFLCLIRQYTSTTHHQCGGCKMGPSWDKKAVVDSELRVYGVARLRVIDASIIPVVMRGNTAAPTMMIAEKGVDSVIKYWQNTTDDYCF